MRENAGINCFPSTILIYSLASFLFYIYIIYMMILSTLTAVSCPMNDSAKMIVSAIKIFVVLLYINFDLYRKARN